MIELEIPGDANELSPNKRMHWRKEHKLKSEWRGRSHLITALAMREGSVNPPQRRVRVSFILRRGRRLDPDNAASTRALKSLVDGLRDAGLLKDDTEQYCERGSVRQEIGREYRLRPSVLVILEEI
jgi:hypothetical protein